MANEQKSGDISYSFGVLWAKEEFSKVKLKDKRLNKRCQKIASDLEQQPTDPINQACEDWMDTKAAYRFFDNPKVTPDKIVAAHRGRTVKRMKEHAQVLAIQDTSFLNYSHHPQTEGLGEIGKKEQKQRGFGLHTTLAVTPQGLPLGFLTQAFFERPIGEASRTAAENQKLPIEEKESYRWIEAFQQTIRLKPEGVQVVTVCDREADIYEMFVMAQEQQADLLVRANTDRRLDEESKKLWEKVESQKKAGELTVDIVGNVKREARQATVSVRFCTVKFQPPWRPQQKKLPSVTLTAILVREENSPAHIKDPIEWLLLTNTRVNAFHQAEQVIEWYCCRWQIEVFHKILKSGCRIEDCRLQTAARLKNYIALMCVVAWRLQWLTYINRTDPQLPCTTVLTKIEWQALYMRIHKTSVLPKTIPSTRQAIRWIAQLGGFLGRKSDGEPGILVIWRGWKRLQDLAATWSLIAEPHLQVVGNR
ncbi:MAG TPA: IS4 family transposase [Anaerolineales bacterium]